MKTAKYIKILLLVGVVCSQIIGIIYLYNNFYNSETNRIQNNIDEIVNDIIIKSTNVFDLIQNNLKRTSAIFRINGIYISKKDYEDYIQFESLPIKSSVESYFWIPRLKYENISYFNNYCSNNIKTGCHITEYNYTTGGVEPATEYDRYYYPIIHAYPPLTLYDIIGFDMMSLEATKIFIDIPLKTINTTGESGSHRIGLSRRDDNLNSHGILINQLSYSNLNTTSDIVGIMMAIVNVNDVLTSAINDLELDITRNDIDIFIFDVTNDGYVTEKENNRSLIYKEVSKEYEDIWFLDNMKSYNLLYERNYSILDRKWKYFFRFNESFITKNRSQESLIILITVSTIVLMINILIIIGYYAFNKLNISKSLQIEEQKRVIATRMLGYVNHEIRNPLNAINGLVELTIDTLYEKQENNKSSENVTMTMKEINIIVSELQTVKRSGNLLKHIVNDILDIRKIEEDKLIIDNKYTSVNDIIENTRRMIDAKLKEKPNVKFIINIDEKLKNTEIFIDKYRINQILLNFLSNSGKFTIDGKIILKTYTENNNIIFKVTDTGRGIPEQAKKKIFNPFSQTKYEDSTRYGGVGLGLYLCKMMTTKMNGTIHFTSKLGEGSSFYVVFPLIYRIINKDNKDNKDNKYNKINIINVD